MGGQTIIGNYFGTNTSGLGQGYGNEIAIYGGSNVIGTGEAGAGNLITGNGIGVYPIAGNAAIQGNLIGPDADGGASAGNEIGILAEGSTAMIGGMGPGEGNVIAFNRTGISVFESSSILSNLFHSNSLIDTDLGGDGPTANDIGDQDSALPNGSTPLQNFPVIVSVTRNSGETVVSGGLNSTAATAFTLQFFANGPSSAPGQRLLGTRTGGLRPTASGMFHFNSPSRSPPLPTSSSPPRPPTRMATLRNFFVRTERLSSRIFQHAAWSGWATTS